MRILNHILIPNFHFSYKNINLSNFRSHAELTPLSFVKYYERRQYEITYL